MGGLKKSLEKLHYNSREFIGSRDMEFDKQSLRRTTLYTTTHFKITQTTIYPPFLIVEHDYTIHINSVLSGWLIIFKVWLCDVSQPIFLWVVLSPFYTFVTATRTLDGQSKWREFILQAQELCWSLLFFFSLRYKRSLFCVIASPYPQQLNEGALIDHLFQIRLPPTSIFLRTTHGLTKPSLVRPRLTPNPSCRFPGTVFY